MSCFYIKCQFVFLTNLNCKHCGKAIFIGRALDVIYEVVMPFPIDMFVS